jgi:excisionase family DNA binding protein
MHAESLLTPAQVAARLGLKPTTLRNWRSSGRGELPWVRVSGRAIRYRLEDLERFISTRRRDCA